MTHSTTDSPPSSSPAGYGQAKEARKNRARSIAQCTASLIVTAVLLHGCKSSVPNTPHPQSAPRHTPASPQVWTTEDEIDRLLAQAIRAFQADRLTTPEWDNAYDRYQAVLDLRPQQEDAIHGLNQIVNRYIELAGNAAASRRTDQVLTYLDRAAQVIPGHPALAMARMRLTRQSASIRQRIPLDPSALSQRPATLRNRLLEIGVEAKQKNARIVIRARHDEEGRWLFAQLNSAPGPRLRAAIERAAEPELLIQSVGP